MRTSCIQHPADDYFLIIRQWQLRATGNNYCAAGLLSFFENWHNNRIRSAQKAREANAIAQQHGEQGYENESLTQWHNAKALEDGLLGLYSADSIAEGIKILVGLGFLRVFSNPNPRFKFDRTKHFSFYPEAVNQWLSENPAYRTPEIPGRSKEIPSRSTENRDSIVQQKNRTEEDNKLTANAGDIESSSISSKPSPVPSPIEPPPLPSKVEREAEAIYNAYPKHAGRGYALKAISKALKVVGYEELLSTVKAYAAARRGQDPQFTPLPATWFNQQRWMDDRSTWKPQPHIQEKPAVRQ